MRPSRPIRLDRSPILCAATRIYRRAFAHGVTLLTGDAYAAGYYAAMTTDWLEYRALRVGYDLRSPFAIGKPGELWRVRFARGETLTRVVREAEAAE